LGWRLCLARATMKLALLVEYDGTGYHGFQRQSLEREPTVQGVLEAAVMRISQQPVPVIGAGRTDSGVHASGQVVHFQVESRLSPEDWRRALNAVLPGDVAVRKVARVRDDFHARYSALARSYRYTVLQDRWPSPLRERYMYRVGEPLDVEALDRACAVLVGEHDFRAFGRSPRDSQSGVQHSCVRLMLAAGCRGDVGGALISFDFTANGFLTGMVRRLVGTLLLVGRGQLDVEGFAQILASRDDAHPGMSVPACGLCLTRVDYPPEMVIWSET
jgi:tRNA pseudouridine38-40 synthase